MLETINPKIESYLFWVMLSVGVIVAYVIGRGDSYEIGRNVLRYENDSTAEKVLTDVITSWIPDRDVVSTAGVIAEPFTARFGTFPDTVIALSKMVQVKYRVPAPVTLAQWALESGFGKNGIGDHNYFGHTYAAVKGIMAHPAFVTAYDKVLTTDNNGGRIWKRVAVRFAKYENIKECFMVHGEYLATSGYYGSAFKQKSVRGFVRELSKHYAEDPDYATKLIAIIERYNLEEKTK